MSAAAVCERPAATSVALAELLARAHEDAQALGSAECPVCDGELRATFVDAECTSCGSRLS